MWELVVMRAQITCIPTMFLGTTDANTLIYTGNNYLFSAVRVLKE